MSPKAVPPKFAMIAMLSEVNRCLPENVFFDSIDINVAEKRVTLGGTGETRSDVRALIKNLEQSPVFKNAREGGATVKDEKSEKFKFQVICDLEREA